MKTTRGVFGLFVLFAAGALMLPIAVTAQAAGATSPGGAAAGDAKNGRELYLNYKCYACHGYSGQNGPGTRLVPTRMNLSGFTAYVRNPRQMPPYTAKAVPDAHLSDIFAYLQTLPKSPSAKDIPLLTQILNEK
jgi:mono/diheme cytochrome c family protein